MRVITGDETGLLKLVDVHKRVYVPAGQQSRTLGVCAMAWAQPMQAQMESLFCLRKNG
jgi:hypothetical protein